MTDENNDQPQQPENQVHNPFDPKNVRISQRFGESQDVRRIIASCPVRKPHRQEFVRVHVDPEMSIEVALLEFREDRQTYLVNPELAPELPGEAVAKILYTTGTSHGALMLWPIRLPDEQGRIDDWNAAAHAAAERARSAWVRVAANMGAGTYDVHEASGSIPEPDWPDLSLDKLLELAFRDRFIEAHDHPVLRRLRGEL